MNVNRLENVDAITASGVPRNDARLKKACSEFEALLINQMLSAMREATFKANIFGSSDNEDIFQSMMDEEIARNITNRRSLGIGEAIYRQLSIGSESVKVYAKDVDT